MSFETGRLEARRLSAKFGSASPERSSAVEIDGERGAPSPKNSLRPDGANTVFREDIVEGLGQIYGEIGMLQAAARAVKEGEQSWGGRV